VCEEQFCFAVQMIAAISYHKKPVWVMAVIRFFNFRLPDIAVSQN